MQPKEPEPYDGGLDISDLDMKAVLKEKKRAAFPLVKNVKLESCERCKQESDDVVWECICKDCHEKSESLTLQIFRVLNRTYNHYGIISWFMQPNTILNGRTPARAIDDGDAKEVLKLALEIK